MYFYGLQPRTPLGRAILDPRATIWTNVLNYHNEMLHTKLQACEKD